MTANDEAIIRSGIVEKRLIRFRLHGKVRIAEPHDYGIRNGVEQLLVYQVAGETTSGNLPNWRWVVLAQASDFELLDRRFSGGRPGESKKRSSWERLFLRVDADTSRSASSR
jgi:hypothetical protein